MNKRTTVWFLARNGQWISGVLKKDETPDQCLGRMSRDENHIIVTKPQGMAPCEWISAMRNAVYKPELTISV
jgi:hypothetical protein